MPIARARVARFTRAIPRSASTASYASHAKIRLSKSRHGPKLWASQNIFAGLICFCRPYPRQNPMYWPQAPAWQASPWGHRPSSSAPCAVPIRLSRIDQHIKEEPCAKQRALLGVLSSRYSSVSRGVRSAVPIWIRIPLVSELLFRTSSLVIGSLGLK